MVELSLDALCRSEQAFLSPLLITWKTSLYTLLSFQILYDLVKKFNKTEVKMKQLLTNVTKYQNTHLPSLRNALVHAKGVEMNKGM